MSAAKKEVASFSQILNQQGEQLETISKLTQNIMEEQLAESEAIHEMEQQIAKQREVLEMQG